MREPEREKERERERERERKADFKALRQTERGEDRLRGIG